MGQTVTQEPEEVIIHENDVEISTKKNENGIDKKEEEEEKNTVNDTLSFYKLLSYADSIDWILMALGTLGSIVHGMAQPLGYLLLGKALNAFGDNMLDQHAMVKALNKVIPFVWYMAFATLPAGILETACWIYSSERQIARMRLSYLKAVLSQEIGAFDTDLTSGKVISGITSNMSIIQDAIGEKLGHFMSSFATFFSGLVIAVICTWRVSLLTFLVVPSILIIGGTYTRKMNTIYAAKMIYMSQATSMVEQTISQIKTVFAFVGENQAVESFTECMEKQFLLSKGEALIKGVGTGMFQTMTFCSWALIIWIGAIEVTAKRAKGGDVIAAIMSILFGAIAITYAAPDLQIFNQAKAAGNEVFKVILRKPTISYEPRGEVLEKIDGNIEIQDVHFAYPSRKDKLVLQGLTLSIPAGKMVALVGSSGCGKSTVISLLTRFYDPLRGEILIDNHNTKDLDLKFLRDKIGLVSQEPSLFSGTIMDNIRVGKMDANDQQIENAARLANAHTFISQLPNHYKTEVGQMGIQLSGGQKQRIAIARAILKNPPILLLDEATSALDTESEKLVQDALDKAMQGRTVIVIAHRMSTVVNADMITVIENGQVAEKGTHHILLETSRFYNKLHSMQDLSHIEDKSLAESSSKKHIFPSLDIEQREENRELNKPVNETLDPLDGKREAAIFFRIWFDLKRGEIVKLIYASLAAAVSGISKPLFGFFIITVGVAYYHENAKSKVGMYSMFFSVVGLLSLFSHILQHYFFGVIGEKSMSNFRQTLYSVVLRNEVGWFEKSENSVGSLVSRIITDTSMVKTIIADRMSVILQCVSSILIATVVSMMVNWRMSLVAWAVMPCHFIGGLIQAKSAKGFTGDSAAAHHEVVSLASESAANIRTIASFCHEDEILRKAELALKIPLKKSRRESLKYGMIQGVSLCLWNIAHAVALWYTSVLVDKNQASFKDAIRSYQIFSLTVPSITELWTLIPTVVSAISVLTPAFETLDRKTEIEPEAYKDSESEIVKGEIEFRNVTFKYPSRPEVIVVNNLNLRIEAGMKVAFVGPSGGGKSSVLALLLRFYDPTQGRVVIDGKDIKEYNLRNMRRQIGLVQQEPILFSSSIRENIWYGTNEASETELIEVSREANIYEFISNLPNGYETIVGEKGCQLSGGQKQRIAIARALLKRPVILLLDEATSGLDAESETSVVNALKSINSNSRTTQITIAHRLSTVVNSDRIIVMEKGDIVERGTHSSLVSKSDGLYSRLVHLHNLPPN